MGTEFDGRAVRTDPDHEHTQHPADTGSTDEEAAPTERDRKLALPDRECMMPVLG
ncbi:hypothetical protein P3H15_46690 [Rhodococcus sp. T2V]|uniref:hypothetical protein n=1 Tax=Rhodococcus sp. T2V TaxID=3034164 RepID=UPI0023E1D46A|nr:hypothetical protein [Rhodococcus sp. T2V]MDF3312442.1 hypothetical protein [Rhodococcus sp. T2V]